MSKYPWQLDTNAELTPVADNATEITAESINALREAVFAIQRAVGTNPQGTATDLKTRLEQILNPDGTFKSAALVAAGLIALPITNAMIGVSAAINESKLDLDVPTQTLQTQIASNNIDIATLQVLYNTLLVALTSHANGTSQRHDGYDIDVPGGLESAPTIATVGAALDFIYNALINHKDSLATNEHPASAISYVPDPEGPFTATNVQEAVTQIDTAFQEDRRKHNNFAHTNGIATDGYSAYGGQVSVASAGRVSRYQPSSGQDQIKLSHINASAIKTKNLNPLALNSTSQSLEFVAKCGSASRTLQVTGLHTALYPATDGRFPVKALVEYLNASFANITNHFPLQAYESDDGEIIIQHNIARSDCTITVQSPLTNSAISAFGFSDIGGIESVLVSGSMAYIDGRQHSSLREIAANTLVLASSSSILDLNTVVGSGGLGLKTGYLVNIYNHATSTANGTYMIAGVGSPPSTQINLITTLSAGTFNYIIYEDVPYMGTGGNPRSVDILWHSDLTLSADTRYEVTLSPISNVSIVEVSSNISAGSGLLQLSTGATNTLQLTIGAQPGALAEFPSGYVGYVRVYAADGINYIDCLISSASLTPITSSIIVYDDLIDDTSIKIASSYFNGGLIVEMPIEKTPIGSVGSNAFSSEFKSTDIELPRYLTLGNGIITGLLTSATSSTQISITGGSAIISGKIAEHNAVTISVFNKISATGTWNVVIGRDNKIDIFDDTLAGYSFGEINRSADHVVLAQLTTSLGSIVTVSDARFLISNSAHKHVPIVGSDEDNGSFTSLEAANLYAYYGASVTDKKIVVATDFTTTSFTISDDVILECLGNMQYTSLTMGSGSELIVAGQLTASSITMQSGSTLTVMGGASVSGSITINSDCVVELLGACLIGSVTMSGSNSKIFGLATLVPITFSGVTDPCIAITGNSNTLENIRLIVGPAYAVSLVKTTLSASNITVRNCALERSNPLGSWATGQIGVEVANSTVSSNIIVDGCTFINFDAAIDINPTTQVSRVIVRDCLIQSCNYGIRAAQSDSLLVYSNILQSIYGTYIDCNRNGSGTLHSSVIIENNIFKSKYSGGSGVAIASGSKFDSITVSNNVFYAIDTNISIINLTQTVSGDSTTYSVVDNVFDNCSSPYDGANFAVTFSSAYSSFLFDGNIFNEHDGGLIGAHGTAVISGNIFDSQSTSGSPYQTINLGTSRSLLFCNNNVITSIDQSISISGASVISNYIDTGYISFVATTARDLVEGNTCYLRSTSIASSISIAYSSFVEDISIFANNIFYTYANTNGLTASGNGIIVISGNTFIPQSGCTNIVYLQPHTSMYATTHVYDNIINAASAVNSNSILIEKHAVFVTGNVLRASGWYPSTAAININGISLSNICVKNNMLDTLSVAARTIISNSTLDVSINDNKNASATIPQSAIDGIQYNSSTGATGTTCWNIPISGKYLISSTSYAGVAIPIRGLSRGARLVSCTVYASVPTGVGSLSCTLFARTISSISASSISSTVSNGGTGVVQITITPTSTTYVSANTEYFVAITSSLLNNIIGSIVVNIYY